MVLAVELAVSLSGQGFRTLTLVLSAVFLLITLFFVYRSFYNMRIDAPMLTADDIVRQRVDQLNA